MEIGDKLFSERVGTGSTGVSDMGEKLSARMEAGSVGVSDIGE